MKLKDLLSETHVISWAANPEMEIRDISFDSRTTQPGDLFVAVKGYESDGHQFIPMALDKGAAAILCEDAPDAECAYVQVLDSRLALAEVSGVYFGHPSRELKVIGVTGTNGKTTVTTLLKQVLERVAGAKVGLVGTNGNYIGTEELHAERTTPDAYSLQKLFRRMADAGCAYAVMEVSSHALFLDRVAGVRFAVGVFTNLTQDHLDFHETMENYAAAKAILFSQCDEAVVNLDDAWAQFMIERAKCPVTTFSTKDNHASFVAKDVRLAADGVRFMLVNEAGRLNRVFLGIPGMFSVYNALTVLSAASLLGLPLAACCETLGTAQSVKGRAEVVPTDGNYTILIDYAVTPDAVENILVTARAFTRGRLVFLFGCGGDRDKTKRPIMGRIAAENADFVIVTSDNPRTEDPMAIIQDILAGMKNMRTSYVVKPDRRDAIRYAIENHRDGDVIILCGKGHENYQIVGREKIHMDEREIIADILQKRKEETP